MSTVLVGFLCAVLLTAAEGSAPPPLTAKEHPWGNFLPKSWCVVQTTTLSNIEGRLVQSKQTVRTVLESVSESGITLEETETLELSGRSVPRTPQTIKYDFFQERIQENSQITYGAPARLMIENDKKVVPCFVRIDTQETSGGQLTTTIWYSPLVYPHVLRVEKILRSPPDGENTEGRIISESVTLVQETSALKTSRSSRRNRTYTLQMKEKAGNITKITDARCSWDVPGGLLASTTREFDAQNREIRRSESRMTTYYVYELVPLPPQRNRFWVPVIEPVPEVPVPAQ